MVGDHYCSGEEGTAVLSLTHCTDDQFTCNNGLCVDISDRCDSNPGCHDLSDEFHCKIINPGKSYQSFIAPPSQSGSYDEDKVVIDVSADIVSILDIDEISSIFHVQFFLHFSWYDPRLTFFNLKTDTGLNALSPSEKQMIWVPSLVFANTENRLRS